MKAKALRLTNTTLMKWKPTYSTAKRNPVKMMKANLPFLTNLSMSTKSMMKTKSLLSALALVAMASIHADAGTVIVYETFGGDGTGDLNGTTIGDDVGDIFASGITTAGGSSTWTAGSGFDDDGDVTGKHNATVSMGSYINDTKGTASGLFTLSATLDPVTDGNWYGTGFFNAVPQTGDTFTAGSGSGFIIYRNGGEIDGFAGPGSDNGVDGPDGQTGTQLLTIVLDLTTHDNTTDFGTVSFYQGVVDPGNLIGSFDHTADLSYGYIGFSTSNPSDSLVGSISEFTLVQVPEPATVALLGLAAAAALRRRR